MTIWKQIVIISSSSSLLLLILLYNVGTTSVYSEISLSDLHMVNHIYLPISRQYTSKVVVLIYLRFFKWLYLWGWFFHNFFLHFVSNYILFIYLFPIQCIQNIPFFTFYNHHTSLFLHFRRQRMCQLWCHFNPSVEKRWKWTLPL